MSDAYWRNGMIATYASGDYHFALPLAYAEQAEAEVAAIGRGEGVPTQYRNNERLVHDARLHEAAQQRGIHHLVLSNSLLLRLVEARHLDLVQHPPAHANANPAWREAYLANQLDLTLTIARAIDQLEPIVDSVRKRLQKEI